MTKTTKTTQPFDDTTPRVELTYLYRGEGTTGKLLYVWAEEEGNGNKRYYAGPRNIVRHAAPGDVYRFPCEGTSIYTGSAAKLVKTLEGPLVVEWAALDRAAAQTFALRREEKRAGDRDQLKEALDPVVKAYWRLGAPQRAQLLAWIVNYISNLNNK